MPFPILQNIVTKPLEEKRRQMVENEVVLKCIFIDILDFAKNFILALRCKDTDIILLVERIDDTKLSYELFTNKFQASPKNVFEPTRWKKVVTQIVHNENDEKLSTRKRFYQKQCNGTHKLYHFVFGRAFW